MDGAPRPTLAQRFARVRAATLALAEPLSEADCQAQSMPDASPVKWHLAHTTWFFETFVLEAYEPGFRPHHAAYRVLFNSYYHGIGDMHPRPQRGLVTRPGLAEVRDYRRAVEQRMQSLLAGALPAAAADRVELGLHHEQQHQELILTDVLHLLSCNPLQPTYLAAAEAAAAPAAPLQWLRLDGGPAEIGHAGDGFAFDNELPRHRVWLQPCALADRLVTQGEWAEFLADGGYREPRWWLSAGWDWLRAQQIDAPMYWQRDASAGGWRHFTLHGLQPLQPGAAMRHVNLYEADAFAQWSAARQGLPLRLPTEFEWEHAAGMHGAALRQAFGEAWQWTRSAYAPYPGFRPWADAAGEYNGKFMANQYVLRGGSFATPPSHSRGSYRNFFPADARWQFSGLRLARDL